MTDTKKPIVNITNYVSSAKISGFDVDIILKKIPGALYRPHGFPATVITTKQRKINLYDSGKIASTKSTTQEKAIQSLYDFVMELNDIGMKCMVPSKPQIVMISATVEYHGVINIDALRNNIHYTKDLQSFPAIQMSFPNGVAVKAYDTKLVITASSIDSMVPAILEIKKYVTCDMS